MRLIVVYRSLPNITSGSSQGSLHYEWTNEQPNADHTLLWGFGKSRVIMLSNL